MKQLLILSGKGGTGKTTVAGALVALSGSRAYADCDVDAPNLHLIVPLPSDPKKTDFCGLQKAEIDPEKCIRCGRCQEHGAVRAIREYKVDPCACEGCGVCAQLCPVRAVAMRDDISGVLFLYQDEKTVFSTARLNMGSGASGKLVTAVKTQLASTPPGAGLAVIDGSPGIGCPVIASISGVDFVLIVAEPTISGIHDLKRVIEISRQFGAQCAVCINKYDVNFDNSDEIESYCRSLTVPVLGRIPFDETVIKAVNRCESLARYPNSPAGKAIISLWDRLSYLLFTETT